MMTALWAWASSNLKCYSRAASLTLGCLRLLRSRVEITGVNRPCRNLFEPDIMFRAAFACCMFRNASAVSDAPHSKCAGRSGDAGRVRYSCLKEAARGGFYAYSIALGLWERFGE